MSEQTGPIPPRSLDEMEAEAKELGYPSALAKAAVDLRLCAKMERSQGHWGSWQALLDEWAAVAEARALVASPDPAAYRRHVIEEAAMGARLVRVSPGLFDDLRLRSERGERITAEWREPDEYGVYEPSLMVHADDSLLSVERIAMVLVDVFRAIGQEHWPWMSGDGWPAYVEGKGEAQVLLVNEVAADLRAALLAEPEAPR